jgi:hypothetical protein
MKEKEGTGHEKADQKRRTNGKLQEHDVLDVHHVLCRTENAI